MYDFSQPTIDAEHVSSVQEYIWTELTNYYFDRPGWWPTVWGAVSLYEHGMFGQILRDLEKVDFDHVAQHLDGDCIRCGTPTGSASEEYRGRYEKPDGETFYINGSTIMCDECLEVAIHELTTYGEPQPRLAQFDGGTA